MSWSMTEKLINRVIQHQVLYDYSHPCHKDVRLKDKVWSEIGLELNENGEELKKKWRNIRDCYQKYLRCQKPENGKIAKRNYRNWQWAPLMEPIRSYIAKNDSNQNPDSPNATFLDESQDTSYEIKNFVEASVPEIKQETLTDDPIQIQEDTCQRYNKRKNYSTVDNTSAASIDRIAEYAESKKRRTDVDATDLIFLGYSNIVKSFSATRQALVKMQIARIIMEEEIRHAEESSLDNSKS